jgi:uncharacterized protein (TIGR00255 family)
MRSMTGFGHAEAAVPNVGALTVDIKTVNGRFQDVNVRLSRELMSYEGEVRAWVQDSIARGRVDVTVTVNSIGSEQDINEVVLEGYLKVAAKLSARGIPGDLDLATLLQLPGVTVPRSVEYTSAEFAAVLRAVVGAALKQVNEARRAEGAALKRDLAARLDSLSEMLQRIREGGGGIKEHYLEKLRQRFSELQAQQYVDDNRLMQELIYYTERSDVAEETTRLAAHVDRFRHHLSHSETTNVGKQFDFLCQEMNREINTILSKSPLAQVSQVAVDAKAEIEKIREQIQNVE